MAHPLRDIAETDTTPERYVRAAGEVFAVFDERSQDSGNISYGVRIGDERYFVKTAGRPDDPKPYLPHSERIALLRNAVRVSRACPHPALPSLHHVIESPHGPLLVYEWAEGELLGVSRPHRENPRSSYQRFRSLPADEILRVLDLIFEIHEELARTGWVAVDFYDGCLIYDFARRRLRIVDLDNYREGPFVNRMGRMFGSSRFMSPEEFTLGAPIDARSNVFTMGRTAALFLSDGTLERAPFRGSDALYEVMNRACRQSPEERFPSMATFASAWREARGLAEGVTRSERSP
jgi:serine/threonine-protein kinase